MMYKLAPLEIPADDPFCCDALNREPSVDALTNLIGELTGPFVLAIDSPWGTGKTTFVQMLQTVLEKKEYPCLYFNAWKTDFSTDPLVAFIGEITKLISDRIDNSSGTAKKINRVKKLGTLLVKRAIPLAAKITTGVNLDLDSFTEKAIADYVSSAATDAVDEYLKDKELIDEFHAALGKAIEQLNQEGKPSQIIIFVDEIDRCRPTYAVELLERIKHLFNIENVIFVVSLDKQQLRTSLGAVYGQGIDADEYLRRFIDLEFLLPKPEAEAFTESLFLRFEFDKFFERQTQVDLSDGKKTLIDVFNKLSDYFDLSLRAREQCFTRIRVVMMTTSENGFRSPYLLTALIILKAAAPSLYRRYAFEGGAAKEVIEHLSKKKGDVQMLHTHLGLLMAANLIAAKPDNFQDELHEYAAKIQDESLSKDERERANRLIELVNYIKKDRYKPALSYVINKIELSEQFK